MKMRVIAAAVLLVAIGSSDPLGACGEKFLMGSRGTRFQRPGTVRQSAAILVYANPALNLARALSNVPFEATLLKAGYRPTVVSSADAFDQALARGGWDLILLDAADGRAVNSRTKGVNAPIVLPVVFNATSAEAAAAKKQHGRILKAPTKNQSFLEAIDDALALRSAARMKAGL